MACWNCDSTKHYSLDCPKWYSKEKNDDKRAFAGEGRALGGASREEHGTQVVGSAMKRSGSRGSILVVGGMPTDIRLPQKDAPSGVLLPPEKLQLESSNEWADRKREAMEWIDYYSSKVNMSRYHLEQFELALEDAKNTLRCIEEETSEGKADGNDSDNLDTNDSDNLDTNDSDNPWANLDTNDSDNPWANLDSNDSDNPWADLDSNDSDNPWANLDTNDSDNPWANLDSNDSDNPWANLDSNDSDNPWADLDSRAPEPKTPSLPRKDAPSGVLLPALSKAPPPLTQKNASSGAPMQPASPPMSVQSKAPSPQKEAPSGVLMPEPSLQKKDDPMPLPEKLQKRGVDTRDDDDAASTAAGSVASGSRAASSAGTWSSAANCPPAEVIAQNFRELDAEPWTLEDGMARMRFVDSSFTPRYAPMPKNKEFIDRAHYRMLVSKGGDQYFCRLCNKGCWGGKWGAQDPHVGSEEHKKRVYEQATADEMVGEAESARRHEPTPGLVAPLTIKNMKRYWGDNINQMPLLIWNALKNGAVMEVDMPHWGKKQKLTLSHDMVTTIKFGAVPYAGVGQGKYGEDSFLVPSGRFEQLIDDNDNKTMLPPQNRGWWPVCQVMWKDMHLHHGVATMEEYVRLVKAGKLKCYVICWYQLLNNGRVLAVWAIIIADE